MCKRVCLGSDPANAFRWETDRGSSLSHPISISHLSSSSSSSLLGTRVTMMEQSLAVMATRYWWTWNQTTQRWDWFTKVTDSIAATLQHKVLVFHCTDYDSIDALCLFSLYYISCFVNWCCFIELFFFTACVSMCKPKKWSEVYSWTIDQTRESGVLTSTTRCH